MKIKVASPQDYIDQLPKERKEPVSKLRHTIVENLPAGFEEVMSYGMPGFVVPHSIYPSGYHCNPALPLPFISIASQKQFIALYHMGIYSNKSLLEWYTQEYKKHGNLKPDMGKSCIRFKKPELIPYDLIGELCEKMTPQDWIDSYEKIIKR